MENQNKFKIIIPSYNNEEWVEPNIASIINQTYTNYDVLYINDASTDNTSNKVNNIINEYNLSNWTLVTNSENQRRGYNISPYNKNIINFMDNDNDILLFIDGDDWLSDNDVLFQLNKFYNQNQYWMTYGGMYCYPSGNPGNPQNTKYNQHIHLNNLYRKDLWRASHLRTFKWHLYKKIKKEDLIFNKTNKYYFHAEDLATSFPCLEMCPEEKIGVVDFPTYIFNETPNNRKRGIERESQAGNELEAEIRNIGSYKTLSLPLNSQQLFKWNRFDLPIKNLFLKFFDKNINSNFGEEIYKEHLKLWNGFKEYNNSNKNTYDVFKNDFINIFKDIKSNNFNWDQSPIMIDNNKFLLNGAHRTAASSYLKSPSKFQTGYDGKDGQKICDYNMFKQLNLNEKYLDASALELVRNNKNLLLVSLFPSATHSRHLVDNILLKYSNIAYKKDVKLTPNGAFNYTLQLYKGEEWAGNWHNNFGGFRDKTRLCFTNNNPMTVYLIEVDNLIIARKIKEEIRQIYNIGNHSVHINDTYEETLRLSRCLFNKNSIHFLNNSELKNYNNFLNQLNYFEQYLIENNLDFEDYCITASSVLSLYGLREGKDLDYLHFNPHIIKGHPDISSHNEYGVERYSKHKDDIIFNPENHFYYGNLKVASLEIVKALKEKRGEEKDYIDINLINKVI
tara:strand:- start:6698 stop:8725 length:2028 start_codon:yes stop_codon:yes gene_type:complete